MSELTQEALVQVAHQYFPAGFPVEKDDYSQPRLAHQRTPEHQRWYAAWERALAWGEWSTFMKRLSHQYPGYSVGGGTQPFASSCLRCFVYQVEPLPEGVQFVTRVAAAVSVLAPLYVVYVTTQIWHSTYTEVPTTGEGAYRLYHSSRPQLTFEPPSTVKPVADTLARLIEQELGYRAFPLSLAGVPLPELRVGYFNEERAPTLLDALFSDNLQNLP